MKKTVSHSSKYYEKCWYNRKCTKNDLLLVPGKKHPAELSEGAGLANVKPPAATHQLMIQENALFELSTPRNQAIIYATQANNDFYKVGGVKYRKGFLLGK